MGQFRAGGVVKTVFKYRDTLALFVIMEWFNLGVCLTFAQMAQPAVFHMVGAIHSIIAVALTAKFLHHTIRGGEGDQQKR